ncbi:Utp14-domain-containing protein [Trametopsis cervina]|nr:Utp14-domain-containing protein [Trametopsis cervina]
MPRSGRPPNHPNSASSTSRKNFNAVGYAKRKSLKSKTLSESPADVYEYHTGKVRRSKIKLELGRDEVAGAGRGLGGDGSEDEGEDAVRRARMQPRLVGENDDEDTIEDEEDEEIDSDAAFEESDEERFAGFSFSHSKRGKNASKNVALGNAKSVRFTEVDLNEDSDAAMSAPESGKGDSGSDEDEEDGDPDEFIDVLDVLDGRGEAESEDGLRVPEPLHEVVPTGRGEPSTHEESDADGDEPNVTSDGESSLSGDEMEADPSALQHLEEFITTLDAGTKRKEPGDESSPQIHASDSRARKRRLLKEQTQSGVESEFAAHPGTTRLDLNDLLAPLSSSANLQSLQKSVKVLASSSSKAQALAAPLPQRTQDRLDREAAYEQTKEEIDKWSATMKRIKEAEHLSFPLQAESSGKVSNLELAAKFKPTTELESAVDKLLKSAKMREQDLAQTEALKMNHLSVEEVAARRAELAKMRELMFRAEAKAKRVAKIKSKTYRRIRKKEKAKLAAKLGELDEDEESDGEEGRLQMEVDRARERATLRHKNTGKWAKAMKARGEMNEDQRKEINEMLDRGDKLRRRIHGKGSDDESESDDSDEHDVDEIKTNAFEELKALDLAGDEGTDSGKAKSVFEMKFMKDAMAREQRRADQLTDDFIREMGGLEQGRDEQEGEDELISTVSLQDSSSQRVGGRVSYRPGSAISQLRLIPSLASDTSSVTLKSTDLLPDGTSPSPATTSPVTERAVPLPETLTNPWLVSGGDASQRLGQKKHEVAISKDSAIVEKSRNKLRKRAKKREEEKEKAKEDAVVDVTLTNAMTLGKSSSSTSASRPTPKKTPVAATDDGDDSEASEVEAQESTLRSGKGRKRDVKAFEQRELVARAFAGDNVVQEFEEEKRREMEADAPKELDTTLAGWGSWGGNGTKKAAPKPYLIKKVAGVDPKSRADWNKAHVIISEKRDKKAAKYLVKDLPYPYTSKAQFERSMDTPLGTEWNTRVGFQRGTLPKVVKKMGTVITPLEKLF